MNTDASAMNQLFIERASSRVGQEKLAQDTGDYIRDKLREVSFARQIYNAKTITKNDPKVQVSVNHDTLVILEEIEPESRAMAITFRGQPDARMIYGERAEVPFFSISSERFEAVTQELQAYRMPITKIIENNSIKDIQEIEDREFTLHIDAAVQAIQAEANSVAVAPTLNASALQGGSPPIERSVVKGSIARDATTDNAYVWPLQLPDLTSLWNTLDGRYLRSNKMLLHETDYNNINQWTVEDFGNKIKSESVVDGYKYSTLNGRKFVRTIKSDILRPGNAYVFTDPKFFGGFYILNNVQFYIDKVANRMIWQAWEDIAMSVINISAVGKLELYSGDATVNDADSVLADLIPKDEDNLGAVNNRVASGLVFPQVKVY